MATLPIGSVALEFEGVELLESPLCGYDYVAKIIFAKNFDRADSADTFTLHKWSIDPSDPAVVAFLNQLSSSSPFMQYMSTCRYMSTSAYMGGLLLEEDLNAVHETFDVSAAFRSGRDFVLDPVVDSSLIVCYTLQYTYDGTCYWTDFVGSYVPITKERYEKRLRPCTTDRNLRYRGINESAKYNDTFREISNDIYYLEAKDTEIDSMDSTILPSEQTMTEFFELIDTFEKTIGE